MGTCPLICYRKWTDMMELSLSISKVAIQFTSPPPPPLQAMQRVFMPPSCLAGPYFLWFWVQGRGNSTGGVVWELGTKGRARKWGAPYRINHAARRTEEECVRCRVMSSFYQNGKCLFVTQPRDSIPPLAELTDKEHRGEKHKGNLWNVHFPSLMAWRNQDRMRSTSQLVKVDRTSTPPPHLQKNFLIMTVDCDTHKVHLEQKHPVYRASSWLRHLHEKFFLIQWRQHVGFPCICLQSPIFTL